MPTIETSQTTGSESLAPSALAVSAEAANGLDGLLSSIVDRMNDEPENQLADASVSAEPAPAAPRAASPMALRSAIESYVSTPRAETNESTFDVIDTDLPNGALNVWDSRDADALSAIYDSTPQASRSPVTAMAYAPSAVAAGTPPNAHGLDTQWFETRFASLARKIDETIADIRPDHAFYGFGQRMDSVELQITKVLESYAAKDQHDGMQQVEQHLAEIVTHLEQTQTQFGRLDSIESHLSHVLERLAAVETSSGALTAPSDGAEATRLLDAVKAAVRDAATGFADFVPASSAVPNDEMRSLFEGFIADTRQRDEHASGLLDTLQLAMITLLDRVDELEAAQVRAIDQLGMQRQGTTEFAQSEWPAAASLPLTVSPQTLLNDLAALPAERLPLGSADTARTDDATGIESLSAVTDNAGDGDRIIAAASEIQDVISAPPMSATDKLRQDYIADARRAKQRLAAIADGGDTAAASSSPQRTERDMAAPSTSKAASPARSGARRTAAAAQTDVRPASASRLMMMALAAISVVGGLWYVLEGQRAKPVRQAAATAAALPPAAERTATTATAPAGKISFSTTSDGVARADQEAPAETIGHIVSDELSDGETSVPVLGIAVDTQKPMNAADFERVQRRQSMAAMSSRLGSAAATLKNDIATPSSLITPPAIGQRATSQGNAIDRSELAAVSDSVSLSPADQDAQAPAGNAIASRLTGGVAKNAPLDLPPAIVGPLSLRLAAANGDPSAEFDVGARLAEGKGGKPDFNGAAKWYQRAADRGFAQAQYRLGTLYERGLGLKADTARAVQWYERAAERGNTKAMHNLAVLSANQRGEAPDYATASRWFTEAAERGLADSQFNLAVLYENGLGMTADMAQAYKWVAIAARSGDKEALRRRDLLKGKMTAEELAKADVLIREWKSKPTDALINDARTAGEAWKKNPQNGVNG